MAIKVGGADYCVVMSGTSYFKEFKWGVPVMTSDKADARTMRVAQTILIQNQLDDLGVDSTLIFVKKAGKEG